MNQKKQSDVDALVSSFLVELSKLSQKWDAASKSGTLEEVQNDLADESIARESSAPELDIRDEELFIFDSDIESETLNQELARALDELESEQSRTMLLTQRQIPKFDSASRSPEKIEILPDVAADRIHLQQGPIDLGFPESLSYVETESDLQRLLQDAISRLREFFSIRRNLFWTAAIVLVALTGMILAPVLFRPEETGTSDGAAQPTATADGAPDARNSPTKPPEKAAAVSRKASGAAPASKSGSRVQRPAGDSSKSQTTPSTVPAKKVATADTAGQLPGTSNPVPGQQPGGSSNIPQQAESPASVNPNGRPETERLEGQVGSRRETAQASPAATAQPGVLPAPGSGMSTAPPANPTVTSTTIPSPSSSSPEETSPARGSNRQAVSPKPITPAVAIKKVLPTYPSTIKSLGNAAKVELDVDVDEKGNVVRATALNGPAILRQPAEEALMSWQFKPASRDGVNIKSTLRVQVVFNP